MNFLILVLLDNQVDKECTPKPWQDVGVSIWAKAMQLKWPILQMLCLFLYMAMITCSGSSSSMKNGVFRNPFYWSWSFLWIQSNIPEFVQPLNVCLTLFNCFISSNSVHVHVVYTGQYDVLNLWWMISCVNTSTMVCIYSVMHNNWN